MSIRIRTSIAGLLVIGLLLPGMERALAGDPPPDARTALLARLADDPTDPEALLGLADAHEKAGHEDAARRYLRAFLRMVYGHPRRVEAARRLAALVPKNPFVVVSASDSPGEFSTYRNAIDGALAVRVPAGPYRRHLTVGKEEEKRTVEIDLPDYLVDLHEATTAAYSWFLWEGSFEVPAYFGNDGAAWKAEEGETEPFWRMMAAGGSDGDRPCWGPSFFEARARARWAGKRVPTEAEWEKAARGGIHLDGRGGAVRNPFPDRPYPWGDAPVVGPDGVYRANIDDAVPRDDEKGIDRSLPVDSMPGGASPYGCLHMAGNVSEWNDDRWLDDTERLTLPTVSPHATVSGEGRYAEGTRAVRGGYFNDGQWIAAIDERDGRSDGLSSMSWLFKAGLRCAADAPPAPAADDAHNADPDVGPLVNGSDEQDPLDATRLYRMAQDAEAKGDRVRAYRFARGAARLVHDGPIRARLVRLIADLRPADPWAKEGSRWRNAIDGKEAVIVGDLLVDVFETTDAELMRFAAEGGYEERSYWSEEGWASRGSGALVNAERLGAGRLPATQVSFFEAQAYAAWARKRLPTAAEWRRLAGVGARKYPWGDGDPLDPAPRCACRETATRDAWSSRSDVRVPVGSFPSGASPEGVMDLFGSQAEWLEGVANPEYPTLRALAGGHGWTEADDFAKKDVTIETAPTDDGDHRTIYGFRCVAAAKR